MSMLPENELGVFEMAFIVWTENYHIGVEKFDRQHREFALIMNDIYDTIGKPKEAENLKWLFKELFKFMDNHFAEEEAFIKVAAEPEYAAHKKAHERLRANLSDMWEQHQMGYSAREMELMPNLKRWFVGHTQSMDRKYVPYYTLRERELARL